MVFGIIGREIFRQGARYIYSGLRAQDRLVDYSYRKAGLYNRGTVTGIKHGLAGGQIIGGTLKLGLPGDIETALPSKIRRKTPYQKRQTRSRYKSDYRRYYKQCTPKTRRGRRYVYSR